MTRPVPGPDLDPMFQFLSALTGLRFPDHRRVATEAAIRKSMAEAGLESVGGYVRQLHEDARLFTDVVADVTVGETYFFREPHHFEFLQQEALPALERRLGDTARLQFWSAGCASGEEAYSLAIVLHESGRAARSSIHWTDINGRALARAREAAYRDWSLRAVSGPAGAPVLPADRGPVKVGQRHTGSSDPPLATAAPFDCVGSDDGVCYRRPVRQRAVARVAFSSRPPSRPAPPVKPADLTPGGDLDDARRRRAGRG